MRRSQTSIHSRLRGLFTNHLPLEGVASFLPIENAAGIAAYMLVAVMHQVLIGDDARGTIIAGTVDDNLIILGKLGQGFLPRGKVQRAGNVLRAVLPVPQG